MDEGSLSPTAELGNRVKNLPTELRQIICTSVLETGPRGRILPFLLAYARAGKDAKLHKEVHEIYQRVNFLVDLATQKAFKLLPMKKLFQVRHLTIVYKGDSNFTSLKGNKIWAKNALETIQSICKV